MTLMERCKQSLRLERLTPCRDADAPHEFGNRVTIRAVLSPHADDATARTAGRTIARTAQLLYDGRERIAAGMWIVANADSDDETRYRVDAVRRYPWLQVAELTEDVC